ncbi:TPA: signal peptidase I [bacterium]|nr:signal peptidase I [bacterium]
MGVNRFKSKKKVKEQDLKSIKRGSKSKFREWVETIVIALILATFIRTFIIQAFRIPTESMEPTLFGDAHYVNHSSLSKSPIPRFIQQHTYLVGDHLFVCKFIYGISIPFANKQIFNFNHPKRFDVVVFKYPEDPRKDFIKRIIGLPGEEIMIRDRQVTINGEPLDDKYAYFIDEPLIPRRDYGPVIIPKDSYFVMGDNRDNSRDSRYWDFLSRELIRGKALFIYWPPQRIKWIR